MNMKTCDCGKVIAQNAKACPNCGFRFDGYIMRWFKGTTVAGLLLIGAVGFAVLVTSGDGPVNYPVLLVVAAAIGAYVIRWVIKRKRSA